MLTRFFLSIYDYLATHAKLRWGLLLLLTLAALASLFRLQFREDIADFLPQNDHYTIATNVYQQFNAADRIFFLFRLRDTTRTEPARLVESITHLQELADTTNIAIESLVDFDRIAEVQDFIYEHAPLLLSTDDYTRIQQQIAPDSITQSLVRAKELLSLPSSMLVAQSLERDPLQLFAPLFQTLLSTLPTTQFELYDGFVFSPDEKLALALTHSPYGASESAQNAILLDSIHTLLDRFSASNPDVEVLLTGVPVISVENAQQIKKDAQLALTLATILILALLFYMLRRVRYLLLILLSLLFGGLIALAALAWIRSEVSLIVLGISSIMTGIAVNYPLHFLSHLRHKPTPRTVLQDIISPLVIGNITTVAAFSALIPLAAPALRDLGIFATFMLVGTILFVILFLPHLCGKQTTGQAITTYPENDEPEYIPRPPRRRWLYLSILFIVTLVLGYFSLSTRFNSDIRTLNYLSPTQQRVLAQMEALRPKQHDTTQVYFTVTAATTEAALQRALAYFPNLWWVDAQTLQQRAQRWNDFLVRYSTTFTQILPTEWKKAGFRTEALQPYEPLTTNVLASYSEGLELLKRMNFAQQLIDSTLVVAQQLPIAEAEKRIADFHTADPEHFYAFTPRDMNETLAQSLADNFNYIGYVSGTLVFLFLWLSFRRLRYALIAFLPMLVTWLWILGTMHLIGLSFNLVNIILATFIFGQGDDYSIFMTEGLIYEYSRHRRILAHYKRSILFSAAIMFIGMGSLILAQHPALRSLGELTVVGMGAVVLLTYLIPPLLFGSSSKNGG